MDAVREGEGDECCQLRALIWLDALSMRVNRQTGGLVVGRFGFRTVVAFSPAASVERSSLVGLMGVVLGQAVSVPVSRLPEITKSRKKNISRSLPHALYVARTPRPAHNLTVE